jgi:hypothetical protein
MNTLRSAHLSIHDLPKPQSKEKAQVALYLESLLIRHLSPAVHFVELPSMHELAEFLGCSFMQLYDAMRALRVCGYDYRFSSLDGAVQIWSNERSKQS